MADEKHRPLRFQNQIQAGGDFVRRRAAALGIQRRRRLRHFNVALFLKNVKRHVEIHWTRPAGQHGRRRLTQSKRQHIHAGRLEAAFDYGSNDVRKIGLEVPVDFLKRTAIEL